jgi:hypothetical protein
MGKNYKLFLKHILNEERLELHYLNKNYKENLKLKREKIETNNIYR